MLSKSLPYLPPGLFHPQETAMQIMGQNVDPQHEYNWPCGNSWILYSWHGLTFVQLVCLSPHFLILSNPFELTLVIVRRS